MSHAVIEYHFVWCTLQRLPLVDAPIERAVYRCIQQQAQRCGCTVLAIGGMPDHVHLVVRAPAHLSPSQIMQRIKGVSSTFVRQQLRPNALFAWREGFSVHSLCAPITEKAIAYTHNQKQHHGADKLWRSLEAKDDDTP